MAGNSFDTLSLMEIGGERFYFHSLRILEKNLGVSLKKKPYSIRILLENLLRFEDGKTVTRREIETVAQWNAKHVGDNEIQFMPGRVLLQDFTGVPAVADLAAMRSALQRWGGEPDRINPLQPVDLVIDHSVQVDASGTSSALTVNAELEFKRNRERYEFLKWAQSSFKNFRVVPPATGICHQVNLEFLAQVAAAREQNGKNMIFPDTVIGTDSHTPMVNGLGVVGWGVGGIEAEAAMLGQPCSMLVPEVIGFRLKGSLPAGTTATDLVLTITQMLRKKGVVGKFVEFFGSGCRSLSVENRATIGNMAPEYGATIGIFPVDSRTVDYLRLTNREEAARRVEQYYKHQDLFADENWTEPEYSDVLELDLSTVEPSVSGPARPQDRVSLSKVSTSYEESLKAFSSLQNKSYDSARDTRVKVEGMDCELTQGDIVIAAITSCTNTSNPSVMLAAGLLARNAVNRGLKVKPWVKTSLAPGSKVVEDYYKSSGLLSSLEALGFHIVGYGCTTCIGNSGPLREEISAAITKGDLSVGAVLSGNRNFEARIHPLVRANYLASPPLVIAYALAGSLRVNLATDPLGKDKEGKPVYFKDLMPSEAEVNEVMQKSVTKEQFSKSYSDVFRGPPQWQTIENKGAQIYNWSEKSSYLQEPPFFKQIGITPDQVTDIVKARCLLVLGDSVTTDHISPAGDIGSKSVAGKYLQSLGVRADDFNSYGARRGNHEVMVRGTFANVRIKNKMLPGQEGPFTKYLPSDEVLPVYEAAEKYAADGTPLIVLAGKEYGSGSSRDWAAKGPRLQGVRAVIAESFERIHRSNLIGMGILPLQFEQGSDVTKLGLKGTEVFTIKGLTSLTVKGKISVGYTGDGKVGEFSVLVRIDTPNELEYFRHGGILPYVLRQLASK